MTNVYLYGHLGRKFGHRWTLDVASPAEAVRALMANRPDFQRYLQAHSEPGYQVFIGADPIPGAHALHHPVGKQSIKIVPVVHGGAKSPTINIIIGIVIIVAAVVTLQPELLALEAGALGGLAGAAAGGGIAGSIALSAGFIGAGLVVSGLTTLLTRQPAAQTRETPANTPSTIFGGPVNTISGGHPVPIGYGRLRVGSAVISAGISTKDVKIT